MPVESRYVEQIASMGASLRWTSRWLNAASFEIEPSKLDLDASLPFVSEIRPVALYLRPDQPLTQPETPMTGKELFDTRGLNYGSSAGQLNQITTSDAVYLVDYVFSEGRAPCLSPK